MQTADSAADVLTQHQRAVLSLLATGLTSAGVGATLRIPVDEVRATARDTIRALGARSKLDAVIIALRRGLIRLPAAPVALMP